MKNGPSAYFPQLTGIRAIAAWMVFLHHYAPGAVLPLPAIVTGMCAELHVGVTLFFVLSGFLIYGRYHHLHTMTLDSWASYITNRVARIYPMYLLLTIFTLLVRPESTAVWFLNLTFLRGFSDKFKFTGIAQGWSLTVEECFYFSAPFFFILMRRYGFWMPLGATYAAGFGLLAAGSLIDFQSFFMPARFMALYTFFGRAFEFFCGMYLARLWGRREVASESAGQSSAFITWLSVAGIGASVLSMSLLASKQFQFGLFHPLGVLLNNILLPVAYAALFFGLLTERSRLRNLLSSRWMVILGKSSYIFYLIHAGVIQHAAAKFLPLKPDAQQANGWIFPGALLFNYAVQFLLLNAVAIALFLWIEEPLNLAIRRLAKGWRERRAALAV